MHLTGNPLADIKEPLEELVESFNSAFVIDFGNGIGLTQYTLFMIISMIVLLIVVMFGVRKMSVNGSGKFAGLVEWGYDAVRRNMGEGAIGHGYKKHMPFLATLFFFILIANIIGLIPGSKAACGTLGVTWALSIISFVYFNFYGIKAKGGLGYIKSLAPSGLPAVMVPIIWFFETLSLILRALTLAVRLYGNMFAGHMVLGIFAVLCTVFVADAFQYAQYVLALPSVAWMFFLIAMYALECMVAFLQAYVFTILSAVYINLATSSH